MDESFQTELIAIIRMALDEQAKAATLQGVSAVEVGIQRVGRQASETERQMNRLRETGERLRTVGLTIAGAGAAAAAPLALAMKAYLDGASQLDPVNRRWLAAQQDIERSQGRTGRHITETLLPALEAGAKLASQIADLADRHPELVSAAVLGVGGTIAIGSTLAGIGQAATGGAALVSVLARLGVIGGAGAAAAGAAGAEGAAVAGTAMGVSAAPILAGALAIAVGGAMAYGMSQLGQWAGRGIYEQWLGSPMGNYDQARQSVMNQLPGQGGIPISAWLPGPPQNSVPAYGPPGAANVGPTWPTPGPAGPGNVGYAPLMGPQVAPELTAAAQAYRAAELEADKRYLAQRAQINKTAADRLVQIDQQAAQQRESVTRAYNTAAARAEEDYERGRLRQVQDFVRAESETLSAYYAQRMEMAARFGVETQRAEEDFQRQQQRRQEDLELTIKDLADRRDGLGILRAQRAAEVERRRAEEDYRTTTQRRDEDFARQISEGEGQLRAQQDQRQEAFDRQRQQEQDDYDLRRARAGADFAQQLKDIDANAARQKAEVDRDKDAQIKQLGDDLAEQRKVRGDHYIAQLTALDTFGRDELERRAMFYRLMGEQFVDFAKALGITLPGSASAAYNAWAQGEQFVPPKSHQAPGGPESIDGALASERRGRGRVNIQARNSFTFYGRLAEDEKEEYRRIANEETRIVLDQVLDGVG